MLRIMFAAVVLGATPVMAATTLDFEAYAGLPDYENQIETTYDGFNFGNFYALDTSRFPLASGYLQAATSGKVVAYNGDGRKTSAISATVPFSLTSAYLTAAWNDGLTITVTGSLLATTVFTKEIVVNTSGPVFAVFNSDLIDTISFTSAGGTENPAYYQSGRGTQFAIDDLTIDGLASGGSGNSVPEPASWAMMVAGFGLIGAFRRRSLRIA